MSFNALLAMEYFSTVAHIYHIDDMPGVISGCMVIMGDQVEDCKHFNDGRGGRTLA